VAWILNDLESLLYVLLYISTGAKLVWAVYDNMQQKAYAVKFATMLDEVLFERDVIEKIPDPLLRKATATLRSVFVVNGQIQRSVSVKSFVTVLKELLD
jgi:hypothetical protein